MKNDNYRRRSLCRLCKSSKIVSVLKLASTPPANAFVSKDECGFMVAIDISRGEGELPKADKNISFVLDIPIKMKCKWKFIPETERSMAKIHFEEIREIK